MEQKLRARADRNNVEREQDLNFIAPLLIDGVPMWKIAQQLTEIRDYEVSTKLVSLDTKRLLNDWKKRQAAVIDTHKALMIERAEKMWFIACENWELSKTGKTKTIQKQKKYKARPKLDSQGREIKTDDLIVSEQQKHHTESKGDIVWYNAMMDAWKLLSEALDLKGGRKGNGLPEPGATAPAAVIQLHFHTKTRNTNNDQYQEVEELDDIRPSENPGAKLLST